MFSPTKKSEKRDQEIAEHHSQIIEDLGNRKLLFQFLWICIAGNAVVWLFVFLMPNFVFDISSRILDAGNKLAAILLGIPFGFGLFTAYCLARLKFSDIEDNKNLESEMMASFNYQAHSTKRWFVWLFSILVGVGNVALLALTTIFLNKGF